MPSGGGAFVKVYNPRPGHSLWRRLRASRAIAEGRGYLAFAAAGIATPELIAWGEARRRGLWTFGFVITGYVDSPTVAESFTSRPAPATLDRAAEALVRIHRAGLAHGDPRLRNFFDVGERAVPFDLCSWGRLSGRAQREDLVKFLGSARVLADRGTVEHLASRFGEVDQRLISDAEAYAMKEGVA